MSALYLVIIAFSVFVYQMASIVTSAQSTDTIYGISFDECKNECLDRPACGGVKFRRIYHNCELFPLNLNISDNFPGNPSSFQKQLTNRASTHTNQSIFNVCEGDTCTITGCPLPQVSYGVIYGNLMTIGTKVHLVCDSGYHPLNDTTATCVQNGTWNNILQCVMSFHCGPPPNISHAIVNMTSSFSAQYSCISGYQQVGLDNISTCRAPDGWNNLSMSCLRICGDPPVIPNTAVSHAPNLEGNIRVYTCLDGFSAQTGLGSDITTCGSDGNWTVVGLVCVAGCGALPSISNGFFSTGGDSIGAVRQYACDGDHTNNGKRTGVLECSSQGTWQPSDSIICKQLDTLGQYCSNDNYCKEPNTTCFRGWCTCKPLYRYSFAGDYCFNNCTTLLDTFTQINQTYIGWYWTDEVTLSSSQTCESVCIANPACLIYEHLHAHAQDCRIGTLSLQQFQDALPDEIDYDYSSSKLFVRNCAESSGMNNGHILIPIS